jgi:phosphatidate cytidylyltransferase
MSNLRQRLLTAGVVIPILLVLFYLGGFWMLGLALVVILIGMIEFCRMVKAKGFPAHTILGTIAALSLAVAAYFARLDLMVMVLTLSALLILAAQISNQDLKTAISSTSMTMMAVIYVGFFLSHIILLRNWEGTKGRVDLGLFLIVLTIAVTFLNDAGAFFIGRKWGKHKMSPVISPKKSWEGVGGAIVFGIAGAALCKLVFDKWILATNLAWVHCIALGALLVGAAIVGDLVESLFKRDAGIKDSGTIVPGHGGILDRLDSIVFTVPVCYYYVKFLAY